MVKFMRLVGIALGSSLDRKAWHIGFRQMHGVKKVQGLSIRTKVVGFVVEDLDFRGLGRWL